MNKYIENVRANGAAYELAVLKTPYATTTETKVESVNKTTNAIPLVSSRVKNTQLRPNPYSTNDKGGSTPAGPSKTADENDESPPKRSKTMDGNSVDKEFYDSIEKSISEQMQQCKTKSLSRIVELEEETCRLQEKVRELEEKYSTQKNMYETTIVQLKKENAELLKKSKACFGCGTVVRAILFCSEDCEKQRVQ